MRRYYNFKRRKRLDDMRQIYSTNYDLFKSLLSWYSNFIQVCSKVYIFPPKKLFICRSPDIGNFFSRKPLCYRLGTTIHLHVIFSVLFSLVVFCSMFLVYNAAVLSFMSPTITISRTIWMQVLLEILLPSNTLLIWICVEFIFQ